MEPTKNNDMSVGFQGDDLDLADGEFAPTFPPTEDDVELSLSDDEEEPALESLEDAQEEETHSGLQSDDEEWEQELTGERPDNGYLPGQRLAEHGIDHEIFPQSP